MRCSFCVAAAVQLRLSNHVQSWESATLLLVSDQLTEKLVSVCDRNGRCSCHNLRLKTVIEKGNWDGQQTKEVYQVFIFASMFFCK